ncbi:hypothetical protein WH47_10174 [Habropoda laboriosa]|uniref:Uncharacterized protein n=1 Tax=Habropoda laboriosa TaxID=597456 RepID=A0A0L7R4A6_9HYME|nr:hypothetical protein WH47_10174 [Habropoda laboriosa]
MSTGFKRVISKTLVRQVIATSVQYDTAVHRRERRVQGVGIVLSSFHLPQPLATTLHGYAGIQAICRLADEPIERTVRIGGALRISPGMSEEDRRKGWRLEGCSEGRKKKTKKGVEALCTGRQVRNDDGGAVARYALKRTPMKHSNDATRSPPSRTGIDILMLHAHGSLTNGALTLDVLPKLEHPSSRKSVRIGESSSIKGPISDDKDLEMNGPCHSTCSLSSERATTTLWTIPSSFSLLPRRAVFAKQRCLKLLIALPDKRKNHLTIDDRNEEFTTIWNDNDSTPIHSDSFLVSHGVVNSVTLVSDDLRDGGYDGIITETRRVSGGVTRPMQQQQQQQQSVERPERDSRWNKEDEEKGRIEEKRGNEKGCREARTTTNFAKHMRDTRAGRLPKYPELFVRACSRELVKTQTSSSSSYALTPTTPRASYLLFRLGSCTYKRRESILHLTWARATPPPPFAHYSMGLRVSYS